MRPVPAGSRRKYKSPRDERTVRKTHVRNVHGIRGAIVEFDPIRRAATQFSQSRVRREDFVEDERAAAGCNTDERIRSAGRGLAQKRDAAKSIRAAALRDAGLLRAVGDAINHRENRVVERDHSLVCIETEVQVVSLAHVSVRHETLVPEWRNETQRWNSMAIRPAQRFVAEMKFSNGNRR